MLTPKQIRIFEAFLRRPYKELTYRDIKEFSRERSNSLIQKAIAAFLTEKLVRKRKIGNIFLYRVDLVNSTVFSYFDLLLNERLAHLIKEDINIIKEEIFGLDFVSIVIFGSYAEGKQTEKSDLDLAFFVNSAEDKKNCELSLTSAELKPITPLDAHVILREEMLHMLKDKQENLGKQIARKHLAIHNPMIFYSILTEGINNGFKLVSS